MVQWIGKSNWKIRGKMLKLNLDKNESLTHKWIGKVLTTLFLMLQCWFVNFDIIVMKTKGEHIWSQVQIYIFDLEFRLHVLGNKRCTNVKSSSNVDLWFEFAHLLCENKMCKQFETQIAKLEEGWLKLALYYSQFSINPYPTVLKNLNIIYNSITFFVSAKFFKYI